MPWCDGCITACEHTRMFTLLDWPEHLNTFTNDQPVCIFENTPANAGIMISYLLVRVLIVKLKPRCVVPIKQNNQSNQQNLPRGSILHFFFCQTHCANSNQGSLYISKGLHLQGWERLNHSTHSGVSCGEASVMWILLITQSSGDCRDKYLLTQITGNHEVQERRPANPGPGLGWGSRVRSSLD